MGKKDVCPDLPQLDLALTVTTFGLLGVLVVLLLQAGQQQTLGEFVAALVGSAVVIKGCKLAFRLLFPYVSSQQAQLKSRNARKFGDQSWQFTVHFVITVYECHLVATHSQWAWLSQPETIWAPLSPAAELALRRFYMVQLGVWFATAFSHKFVEARHKDYFVMYTHHVVTLALIIGSYFNDWMVIGLVVVFLHDSSDIAVDLLKMCNYAGLDGPSHFYVTELSFVVCWAAWFYSRLYIFPTQVITACMPPGFALFPGPMPVPVTDVAAWVCRVLLVALLCMHVYWWILLGKLAVRMLSSENAHDAGRQEYEGGSSDESETEEEETTKGKLH